MRLHCHHVAEYGHDGFMKGWVLLQKNTLKIYTPSCNKTHLMIFVVLEQAEYVSNGNNSIMCLSETITQMISTSSKKQTESLNVVLREM